MAEYIEREAFLKDIEERYCLPCKEAWRDHNGCKCRACWVDDMRGDVIDAPAAPLKRKPDDFCSYGERKEGADYLIRNGVTVQEWISVEDRLPEYSNDGFADAVLVTDGFVQHMAYFVGGEWRFAESGEIKEPMWYRITHWMPLPQPPKGE